ncbi:GUN4 domain-containing protein [Scytonema tolypothrichoides VB-61278]|nr:GUN4 domain-containing protein [Scytonema tolypothrichoides VB-61278]
MIYTEEEINRRKQNKLLPLRAGLVILDSCKQTFQEIQNQYYHTPYGWLFNYHTVNLRESKAPVQELIGAITGQPWQVDDSSRELIKTQNTPQNHLVDSGDDLSSKTGVDYTQLENFLKAEQWKKADQETFAVMLQATGREQEGWLDVESIENFPCTHLSTIDQLWVKYSEGRFGFSVQNRILESVGWDYAKYGKCVGWRKGKFWNWLHYNQLTFSTNAPHGHLPALSIVAVLPAGVNLSLVVPSMLLPITRKFLTWSLYTNEIMRGLLSMWDANGYLKPQRLSLFSRVQTCKV